MSTPGMPVVIATEHERAVLALFVAQLKLPECRERCQIEFNTALASDQPVERVARRLSICLTDHPPSPTCTTLLQLIDSVNLPPALLEEAAALHEQLVAAEDTTAFGHHVRQLAGLIDALPSQLQQEKDEIAQCLVTLGDRLHELYTRSPRPQSWQRLRRARLPHSTRASRPRCTDSKPISMKTRPSVSLAPTCIPGWRRLRTRSIDTVNRSSNAWPSYATRMTRCTIRSRTSKRGRAAAHRAQRTTPANHYRCPDRAAQPFRLR